MWQIDKIKELKRNYDYNVENVKRFTKGKKGLTTSLKGVNEDLDNLENIIYTTKLIIEKITYESKKRLEAFLTYALKNVFTDRDYEIKLSLKEETKKPGLELILVEDGVEQEITDAIGGGILSTLGLLLQIYYIEVFDINKIIFIDEGLKEVSSTKLNDHEDSYLENLLVFLKWLAQDKKYKIVLITHDSKVRNFADRIYEVKKGVVSEC